MLNKETWDMVWHFITSASACIAIVDLVLPTLRAHVPTSSPHHTPCRSKVPQLAMLVLTGRTVLVPSALWMSVNSTEPRLSNTDNESTEEVKLPTQRVKSLAVTHFLPAWSTWIYLLLDMYKWIVHFFVWEMPTQSHSSSSTSGQMCKLDIIWWRLIARTKIWLRNSWANTQQ